MYNTRGFLSSTNVIGTYKFFLTFTPQTTKNKTKVIKYHSLYGLQVQSSWLITCPWVIRQ